MWSGGSHEGVGRKKLRPRCVVVAVMGTFNWRPQALALVSGAFVAPLRGVLLPACSRGQNHSLWGESTAVAIGQLLLMRQPADVNRTSLILIELLDTVPCVALQEGIAQGSAA